MADKDRALPSITPGVAKAMDFAVQIQKDRMHERLGLNHLLLALVDLYGSMAEGMAKGLQASSLQKHLENQLQQGTVGAPVNPAEILTRAREHALARGKQRAAERDLAFVILSAAGYQLVGGSMPAAPGGPAGVSSRGATDSPAFRPRATRPTPTLEKFGHDLTRDALERKLMPIVGRDVEIQAMVETLCRRTKRNPALVGPAGVGKTAIVEGFAQRVVGGQVPEILRNTRVLSLQPSLLFAGIQTVGEAQERTKAVISEACQDGVILFIDEMHSVIGAGGMTGTSDVASMLKPALARGDLSCIGATTDDEYRRFIESDEALERRFQPIRVQELTAEQTLEVLAVWRDELARLRGVEVSEPVVRWLVHFARQYMRNRYFPDKAVDLLEQCVAAAIAQDRRVVDQEEAQSVARRMVGMPAAIDQGLVELRARLSDAGILADEHIDSLVGRLEVTTRGLDLRPTHPNTVALLLGDSASSCQGLAETIAQTLFGARERVVTIDFGRFVERFDITMLIGAPPGYVGYSESLPIHEVAQMPWCVLVCQNVDACHPLVRQVLTRALREGFLTDARGKRIYLSDTVVLLTARIEAESRRRFGFHRAEEVAADDIYKVAEKVLGAELLATVDLACAEVPPLGTAQRRWFENTLLVVFAERYRRHGLHIAWDESVTSWLLDEKSSPMSRLDWERRLDRELNPLLVRYLPPAGGSEVVSLVVKYIDDAFQIAPQHQEGEGEY